MMSCSRIARQGRPPADIQSLRVIVALSLALGKFAVSGMTSAAQPPFLGRGVNVLGYDPIWRDRQAARFTEGDFARIKQGGFSTLRVNLQAFAHMDGARRLDPRWLETLDWGVREAGRAGLAIILDEHDSSPCSENVPSCRERLLAFWRQVAERYRMSPATVLFEPLNEPNGELTPERWNALLIDVLALIRRTNPTRWVVIGPGRFDDPQALPQLKLPERDRRILVTVHYYEPFPFTHQGTTWTTPSREKLVGVTWGTPADRVAVARDFDAIAAWSHDHARPILLGEFGAYGKGDMTSRVAWTSAVARAAEQHGMAWCYWQFDGDFIVFDKRSGTWVKPIHDALVPP